MTLAAAALAVVAFYGLFYRTVVRRWGRWVNALVERLGLAGAHPVREVEAVGKLAAAGVAQAVFAIALMAAAGVDPGSIASLSPELIVLGAALGLGELGLAGLLATALLRLFAAGGSEDAWLAQAGGGWMGLFGGTVAAAPSWFAWTSVCLYVGGEELVFRGILVQLGRPSGALVAVGLALVLFVAVQAFNMPSARAATFPMVGAAIVGTVHGVLFWHVPDVVPLVAAHLTFFAGALALAGSRRPAAAWAR